MQEARPGTLFSSYDPSFSPITQPTAPGEGHSLRTATAVITGVRPRAAPVPTGTISRACGAAACPRKHGTSQPLSLVMQLPNAFAAATVTWARADTGAITGVSGTQLTIAAANLPAAGAPLTVVANISLGGELGSATITVQTNAAPYCSLGTGNCLSVEPRTGQFPGAEFVATALGFSDDDDGAAGIIYEWGVMGAGNRPLPLLIDRVTTFKFSGLPVGGNKIYVRAVDAQGAVAAREDTTVTVLPPQANFNPKTAVDSVDVSQVESLGDPAVLNQAANSIAALASFGASSADMTAEDKEALQSVVDDKGSALLKASASQVDAHDLEASHTAAFSAVSMVKVMNASVISDDTKEAALNIGKNRESDL